MNIEKEIENLALSRSICYAYQKRGYCNPQDCEYCDLFIKQSELYSSLPAAGQLEVNNRVYYQAGEVLSVTPPAEKPGKNFLKTAARIIGCGIIFALIKSLF